MIIHYNEIENFNKTISNLLEQKIPIPQNFFNGNLSAIFDENDKNLYIASLMIDNMFRLNFIEEEHQTIKCSFPSFSTRINIFYLYPANINIKDSQCIEICTFQENIKKMFYFLLKSYDKTDVF
jgi:hypothetical protein